MLQSLHGMVPDSVEYNLEINHDLLFITKVFAFLTFNSCIMISRTFISFDWGPLNQ